MSVPGFIEQVYFTEGQQVKSGDLLFRIEQATYQAAVQQQRTFRKPRSISTRPRSLQRRPT